MSVEPWPIATAPTRSLLRRIKRPCDWGLEGAVQNLEIQLGTVEAYNRLVEAAEILKARIDASDIKPQNPLFAVNVKG
jgi:hypothetical protein